MSIRFEEVADGLRVIDAERGTELSRIDGATSDFVPYLVWGPQVPLLAIIDGVRTRAGAPVPFRATEEWVIAESGGELVAVAPTSPVTYGSLSVTWPPVTWDAWRSDDARSWRGPMVIGDDPSEPRDSGLWVGPGGWRASSDVSGTSIRWDSPDGITWQAYRETRHRDIPHGKGEDLAGHHIAGYQFAWMTREPGPIWFRADDSGELTRVAAKELRLNPGVDLNGLGRVPDSTVLWVSANRGGRLHHWLFQFDDLVEQ